MELHARANADGAWVMALHGELDLAAAPSFRSAALQSLQDGWIDLVVDLESVSFIDSAGLGVLIGLRRRVRDLGGTLSVRVNDVVADLIASADLASLFELDRVG